jgi:hypothetical protein
VQSVKVDATAWEGDEARAIELNGPKVDVVEHRVVKRARLEAAPALALRNAEPS